MKGTGIWTPAARMLARLDRSAGERTGTMEHFHAGILAIDLGTRLHALALVGLREERTEGRGEMSYRLSRASSSGDWLTAVERICKGSSNAIRPEPAINEWILCLRKFMIQASGRDDSQTLRTVAEPLHELRNGLLGLAETFRRPTPLSLVSWSIDIRNKTIGHGAFGGCVLDASRGHCRGGGSVVVRSHTPMAGEPAVTNRGCRPHRKTARQM